MMPELVEILKGHCRPLQPIPTETPAQLRPLPGIRAALFDVYGTMLVSGSGDVGTVATAPGSAVEAPGLSCLGPAAGETIQGDTAKTQISL